MLFRMFPVDQIDRFAPHLSLDTVLRVPVVIALRDIDALRFIVAVYDL